MAQTVLNQRKRSNMIWRFIGAFLLATGLMAFGMWRMFRTHGEMKGQEDAKSKVEVENIKNLSPLIDSLSSMASSIKFYNDDISKNFPSIPERFDNSSKLLNAGNQIKNYSSYLNKNNQALKKDQIENVFLVLSDYFNFTRKMNDLRIANSQAAKEQNSEKKEQQANQAISESTSAQNFNTLQTKFNTLVTKLKEKDCGEKILKELGIQ